MMWTAAPTAIAGVTKALSCAVWNSGISAVMRSFVVEPRVDRDAERLDVDGEMAADDALRRRRRAAGVEIGNRIAVFDIGFRLVRRRVRDKRFERVRACGDLGRRSADDDDVGNRRRVFEARLQLFDQHGLDNDGFCARMREHIAKLLVAPEKVDRHADQAELGAGVVDGEEFRIVGRHQRQSVASRETEPGERMRGAVGESVELGDR